MPDADDFDVEYFRNLLKGNQPQEGRAPAAEPLPPAKGKTRQPPKPAPARAKGKPTPGRKRGPRTPFTGPP